MTAIDAGSTMIDVAGSDRTSTSTSNHGERAPWWRGPSAALGASVAVFYWWTAAPSLVWADGARLQTEAITGRSIYLSFPEFDHRAADGWPLDRLGVAAWDHPLWVAIGHAITRLPVGDDLHLLNLLSAAAAVAGVVVFFQVMELVVGSRPAALAGAGCLAVSHTFWFHAVTAEVYSLHVLFMGALIGLAVRYHRSRRPQLLVWFALLAGLGVANHVMLGLTIVPLVLFLRFDRPSDVGAGDQRAHRASSPVRFALIVLSAFLVGLAPWWMQFARMARMVGVGTTMQTALGFPWLSGRFPGPLGLATLANALEYLLLLTYQFTPIGLALGLVGVLELRRRAPGPARWLVVLFVLHSVFSANYDVPDRFTFHITSYAVFSVFVAAGVARVIEVGRRTDRVGPRWRSTVVPATMIGLVVVPVALYEVTPPVLAATDLDDALAIPEVGRGARDGVRYFLDPDKRGDTSATAFGRNALESLAPHAVVIAPWPGDQETYVVLRHFQLVDGLRPDVHLDLALFATGSTVTDRVIAIVDEQGPCRPVYVASRDVETYPWEWIDARYQVVAEGMLYRLRARRDPDPGATCPPIPGPPLGPAELVERATHG